MKEKRRNSYYRRLQISFVLLVFFPTIILSFITYFVNKDNLIEKVTLSNETVLNVIADDIKSVIDDITFTSHVIVQDEEVKQILNYLSGKETIGTFDDYLAYKDLRKIYSITEMRTLHQDLSVFLINNKRFIISSFRNIYPNELLHSHWDQIQQKIDFNQGLHLQWIGPIYNEDNQQVEELYFSRVIRDENAQETIGILNTAIPIQKFEKLFSQGPIGDLALYDEDGDLIFGSVTSSEGKHKKEIRTEKVFTQFKWKLVHSVPQSYLTAELRKTLLNSILVLSLFIIIFLVMSLIMAKKLHHPIKGLQKVATEFGAGNRDVRFKDTSYSEINDLGQSINKMFNQINDLIVNIKLEQERKKELEINALYSQIRPHFLINTLNSIKVNLVLDGNSYNAEKMGSLIMLLRKYLESNKPSTLKNECEFLTYYIDIMNMRNEMEINLDLIIPEELGEFELPFLLLQPIVENAIIHGFKEDTFGTITVHAFKEDHDLVIQITDDGTGMSRQQCKQLNTRLENSRNDFDINLNSEHVGLTNISQRLYLTYGEETSFTIDSEYGIGTTIELKINIKNNRGG